MVQPPTVRCEGRDRETEYQHHTWNSSKLHRSLLPQWKTIAERKQHSDKTFKGREKLFTGI